ncbi:MAG: thiamine-phosphate kinase [Anaerolineales bacterium]|nr:thiamine-phosphate kinase [Anaerolineales bacterium]
MNIGDIGEFALIQELSNVLGTPSSSNPELLLSIGDDAAAWKSSVGITTLSTDTLVEGTHFELDWMGWSDIGWKAVAVNLSDVAAMGCVPSYGVVTLGLRQDMTVEGVKSIYEGISKACIEFGIQIVGGDTVESPTLFITIAVMGHMDKDDTLMTRGGACIGDLVAVTGNLGRSSAGLRILQGTDKVHKHSSNNIFTESQKRPTPRLKEGRELVKAGVLAAMDLSDGLITDMGKICEASGVGISIDVGSIPVDAHLQTVFPDDWLDLAMTMGEDYELVFTASKDKIDLVNSKIDIPVTVIGQVTDTPREVIVKSASGETIDVQGKGWSHFSSA